MGYSKEEHIFRAAAWAASRSASSVKGYRFRVKEGQKILENTGFNKITSISDLLSPENFDKWHDEKCQAVIKELDKIDIDKIDPREFSYGIAAKLINIYLKAVLLCGCNYNDKRMRVVHPPIDRVLLQGMLNSKNIPDKYKVVFREHIAWSKYKREHYFEVIKAIKAIQGDEGLWAVEEYWQGYQ